MSNPKYFISAAGDNMWYATGAKTINGAKAVASKTYNSAFGGKIEVAELVGTDEQAHYEQVAIKHGFDKWQSAY